jgi:hypothetical protein
MGVASVAMLYTPFALVAEAVDTFALDSFDANLFCVLCDQFSKLELKYITTM